MAPKTYVKPSQAAVQLGVPEAWLRREADRGAIPHLKVGRRLLFNVDQVQGALAEMAEQHAGRAAHG